MGKMGGGKTGSEPKLPRPARWAFPDRLPVRRAERGRGESGNIGAAMAVAQALSKAKGSLLIQVPQIISQDSVVTPFQFVRRFHKRTMGA